MILEPRDPQAKGLLERSHRFMRTNFEPGRVFANHLDFQDRLDAWTDKANERIHRTIRAVPARAAGRGEDAGCGRCPPGCPTSIAARCCGCRRSRSSGSIATTTRSTRRSLAAASRSASPRREITAVVLDTGELAARHRRVFAGGLTLTDPAHQTQLERQREKRRQRHEVEVEIRPLARYDQLIPA